jgi:hypothetical protein
MRYSEQISEIAAALSKAQGAMQAAIKDSINPAFRSKYADLAASVEAARKPLADNGLAVIQEAVRVDSGIAVSTRILHASGQWIDFDALVIPLAKADAHGIGSATTYGRRYSLGAALGLVAEDDDGNAAAGKATDKSGDERQAELPIGFPAFWKAMQDAAKKGQKALEDAWKVSSPDYRRIVSRQYAKDWADLKQAAGQVKVDAEAAA